MGRYRGPGGGASNHGIGGDKLWARREEGAWGARHRLLTATCSGNLITDVVAQIERGKKMTGRGGVSICDRPIATCKSAIAEGRKEIKY